jgi:hypothetical protein
MKSKEVIRSSEIIEADSRPANYDQYADEILVANEKPPLWLTRLPYLMVIVALGYYFHVRPLNLVNMVFAVLFIIWLVYTPIAKRQGWFYIPL